MMLRRRRPSRCIPCALGSGLVVPTIWFITNQLASRYWAMREQQASGKTLRGRTVRAQGGGEGEEESTDEDGGVVANLCQVTWHEECDVYTDWLIVGGERYEIGHHLENCHTVITSVSCDDGGGGPGGAVDPGPNARLCLRNAFLTYQNTINACRRTYNNRTAGIEAGLAVCTIAAIFFSGGAGTIACGSVAVAAEVAASFDFNACLRNNRDNYETDKAKCVP
jgi:hypothetical protein